MKKTILALAAIIIIGIAGLNQVEARWNNGYGQGQGHGNCNGPGVNLNSQIDTPAHDAFLEKTVDLRKQLQEKQDKYFEAMHQESPDKELASQLWNEMFDLREQVRTKAEEAGFDLEKDRGRSWRGGGYDNY